MQRTVLRVVSVVMVVTAGVLVAGCATVDATSDYGRLTEQVAASTGVESVYRPDEDAAVAEHVARLLADGITAGEAAQIALLNDPSFQSAAMKVGMGRADVVQSGLLTNPVLSLNILLPSGGGLAEIQMNVAQNIAELWQIPVRVDAAEADLDAAILDLAYTATRVAAEAKGRYFTAVGADALLAVARENEAAIRDSHGAVVKRRTAGAGTELDVNLAAGPLIEAELAVASRRLAAAQARRELAAALGLVEDADGLVLADALPSAGPEVVAAEQMIAAARAERLDLQVAQRQVDGARERVELEKRKFIETLTVGVGMERGARRNQGGRKLLAETVQSSAAAGRLAGPSLEARPEQHQNAITGPALSVELPIWDQNQAQVAKAEYALRQAEKDLAAIERAMVQEVRGVADRAQTAWSIAATYRAKAIPLAERNLSLAQASYGAGKTSVFAVLEAQRYLLDVRTKALESQQQAAALLPELERVTGRPLAALVEGRAAGGETVGDRAAASEVLELKAESAEGE